MTIKIINKITIGWQNDVKKNNKIKQTQRTA